MPELLSQCPKGLEGLKKFAAALAVGLLVTGVNGCVPVIKNNADSLNNWRDGSIYDTGDFSDFQPFVKKPAKEPVPGVSDGKSDADPELSAVAATATETKPAADDKPAAAKSSEPGSDRTVTSRPLDQPDPTANPAADSKLTIAAAAVAPGGQNPAQSSAQSSAQGPGQNLGQNLGQSSAQSTAQVPVILKDRGMKESGKEPGKDSRGIPHLLADSYTVQPGDTLHAISRHYLLPVAVLAFANSLEQPYSLTVGQKLVIPHPRLYTVMPGDTLYSLSREFKADQNKIIMLNQLSPPYALPTGIVIALPDPLDSTDYPFDSDSDSDSGMAAQPSVTAPVVVPPLAATAAATGMNGMNGATGTTNGPLRITPPSDSGTAKGSAAMAGVGAGAGAASTTKAAAKPATAAATKPPAAKSTAAKPPAAKTDSKTAAQPAAASSLPAKAAAAPVAAAGMAGGMAATGTRALPVPVAPAAKPAAKSAAMLDLPPPPLRGGKDFLWPIEGRRSVNFGDRVNGVSSSGIRILTRRGSPVVASENGTVAYADNDSRSLGKQVIIRHAGGFITVYAYLDSFKVRRGTVIHRGQEIGTTGQSIDVKKSELYFAIHKDNEPVDPMKYLAKQ